MTFRIVVKVCLINNWIYLSIILNKIVLNINENLKYLYLYKIRGFNVNIDSTI